jgi:hypothetical protein
VEFDCAFREIVEVVESHFLDAGIVHRYAAQLLVDVSQQALGKTQHEFLPVVGAQGNR